MTAATGKIIEDLGSLPPIPHIAAQVLRLVSDPDCSVGELQRVISSDQALAAQMLKMANSSAFGMVRKVHTLTQAIMALGLNMVKSVAIASCAKNLYLRSSASFFRMIIWEHALIAALAGHAIAKAFRFQAQDEVFLGALMHDIGKSVMSFKYPDVHGKILKDLHEGKITDGLEAEREAFGMDHAMLGEALVEMWNLPTAFSQCVRWHHSPSGADPEWRALTAYVTLGNLFALEMGKGIGTQRDVSVEKAEALQATGISGWVLALHKDQILESIETDELLVTGF